jgi:hypothetical protein
MDMNWRTSSYSSSNGGNCVETASDGRVVAVRDTKDHGTGTVLTFTPSTWRAFLTAIK